MEEDVGRARRYSKLKIWAAIVQFVLTVAFLAIMLISGASIFLKEVVAGWTQSFCLEVGLYMAILSGIFCLLFLPLDFYESFLLEYKFGLSTQTVLGWAFKGLKKGVVSLPLFLLAGEALYFFLRSFPDYWWLLSMGPGSYRS